jgi:dTDP-4-amino-4,6-dideoxygalactose transaminase
LGYKCSDFPVAERVADEVLSLPIYPELKESQINQVCSAIRTFAAVRNNQPVADG